MSRTGGRRPQGSKAFQLALQQHPSQTGLGTVAAGHVLGSRCLGSPPKSRNFVEARTNQATINEDRVAQAKAKSLAIRKQKLEDKIKRYSYLNISNGHDLGEDCCLTLEEARKIQLERNEEIIIAHQLQVMKMEEKKHQTLKPEEKVEQVKTLRDVRLQQQEDYAKMVKKV